MNIGLVHLLNEASCWLEPLIGLDGFLVLLVYGLKPILWLARRAFINGSQHLNTF